MRCTLFSHGFVIATRGFKSRMGSSAIDTGHRAHDVSSAPSKTPVARWRVSLPQSQSQSLRFEFDLLPPHAFEWYFSLFIFSPFSIPMVTQASPIFLNWTSSRHIIVTHFFPLTSYFDPDDQDAVWTIHNPQSIVECCQNIFSVTMVCGACVVCLHSTVQFQSKPRPRGRVFIVLAHRSLLFIQALALVPS